MAARRVLSADQPRGLLPPRRSRDSQAKEVCLACPVLKQCREHALQVREPYGVWGAMTEDEREAYYAGHAVPAAS